MTKKKALILVIIELIVLLAASLLIYRYIDKRAEQEAAEKREQELAEQQEREAAEEAEKEKIRGELGQWNLMLVNNQNAIPDEYLEALETAEVEGYEVNAEIKDALTEMLSDCREAGYSPRIISAFRTRETQQYLYDTTANKADTAVPGHSEHECGLALDIIDSSSAGWADPLIDKQETLPAQIWLMEHCQDYGFILRYPKDKEDITEIIYEPWHYRYVGKEHANIIMEEKLCLEEYIEDLQSKAE